MEDAKVRERFGKAIGSFCYIRYLSGFSEIERFGVLEGIYNGLLRIEHAKKPERFWEIPADSITEFTSKPLRRTSR